MNKKDVLNKELWESYNDLLSDWYGFTCTKRQYVDFASYCEAGVRVDEVTPIFNPFNLYAFCQGISSEQAVCLSFERKAMVL